MRYLVVWLMMMGMCVAQNHKGKTFVVKVRAPLAGCKIEFSEPYFLLEKESDIRIKLTGKNPRIRVEVKGGKIVSENGEHYTLRFLTPGPVAISVFQLTDHGEKQI